MSTVVEKINLKKDVFYSVASISIVLKILAMIQYFHFLNLLL